VSDPNIVSNQGFLHEWLRARMEWLTANRWLLALYAAAMARHDFSFTPGACLQVLQSISKRVRWLGWLKSSGRQEFEGCGQKGNGWPEGVGRSTPAG